MSNLSSQVLNTYKIRRKVLRLAIKDLDSQRPSVRAEAIKYISSNALNIDCKLLGYDPTKIRKAVAEIIGLHGVQRTRSVKDVLDKLKETDEAVLLSAQQTLKPETPVQKKPSASMVEGIRLGNNLKGGETS